jgi:hypothetical protein
MSTYNPQVLIRSLEELQGDVTRWIYVAASTVESAQRIQRLAKDQIEFAYQQVDVVNEQAMQDEQQSNDAASRAADFLRMCEEIRRLATRMLAQAQEVVNRSEQTLRNCESALRVAEIQLAEAEQKYEQAKADLIFAQQRLAQAERTLASTPRYITTYDDKGRSKTESNPAYDAAQAAVVQAQAEVAQATHAVEIARQQVERARARVERLKRAVSKAQEAVSCAYEGERDAHCAVENSEEGLKRAQAAQQATDQARHKSALEIEEAQQMRLAVNRADEYTNEGQSNFRDADTAINSTQILERKLCQELDYRVEQLYELDRPSL